MIALLFFASQLVKTDVELAEPVSPGIISVEALMRLPKTGPQERADLAILADSLLEDTEEYGRRQLVKLTVMSGETVRCDLYPDCLRIRFGVLQGDAASVIPILSNIVHSSELQPETLTASAEDLQFRRRDYWSSALEPEALKFGTDHFDDIQTIYKVMGRPENLCVTFAAPPDIGLDLVGRWRDAVASWDPGSAHFFPPDRNSSKPVAHRRGKLTTVLLRGRPINPADPSFVTNLLAMFALGGGKDSAVWKALREGLGWSYRQEAFLRNSPGGLEPCVEVVMTHAENDMERSLQVRPALEKAVELWTDDDKKHAVASAEALFHRGLGLDPLYFKGTRPATNDPLFMQTYWRFKTGLTWNSDRLLGAMENIDVHAIQAAATEILDKANVELIQGTG